MEEIIDRFSIRSRPKGLPVMHQSWTKLLFLHWSLHPDTLRRHLPKELSIDTYDGKAWIGITPFQLTRLRPVLLPPLPCLSTFPEINVRTYVHCQGVPGVWFFSLDAGSLLAVIGARLFFRLPYYPVTMKVAETGNQIEYQARRIGRYQRPALLEATCDPGNVVGPAEPGSLEFFLVERYCLYAKGPGIYRARIFHKPWVLREAKLHSLHSTMLGAQDLPEPSGAPSVLFSEGVDVAVWPLERVR